MTFAEKSDAAHDTDWHGHVIRTQARWCSAHATAGDGTWGVAGDGGLFATWRDAEQVDRTLEINGLRGWRRWVAALPDRPDAAMAVALDAIDLPAADRLDYFYRLLGGLYGWASYFRRASWTAGDGINFGDLGELLAIRLCGDAAVAALAPVGLKPSFTAPPRTVEDEATRAVMQEALEDGYARRLVASFRPPVAGASVRPAVQALFCIDVRSEPLRRHLEAQPSSIETRGFAGFFGVSVAIDAGDRTPASARCPVLLRPAFSLRAGPAASPLAGVGKCLQSAPAAAFSFVELLGLGYAPRLAADAGVATGGDGPPGTEATAPLNVIGDGTGHGLPEGARVDAAAAILKFTGLSGGPIARLVMLCGHAGRSANNPHAAGLDCGACGGHGGAVNARVAAMVLNEPAVRDALRGRGVAVPDDTVFVPVVHDTSSDEVTPLDVAAVPATHVSDLAGLRATLARAAEATRAERAAALGIADVPPARLAGLMRRRARDWSEVRPEWAIARNAAFVAARRGRTRGVDLRGRAFLHEYDAAGDADASILTLILSAPMVVASWINLQYFASTVDNDVLGCGDKTLHNRVGALGVVLGNGGDLRTGLAKQSVHAADGSWHHEPLRLQVFVEAPRERIDSVLATQAGVAALVDNGWLRLFAVDSTADRYWLRARNGWEPFAGVAAERPL